MSATTPDVIAAELLVPVEPPYPPPMRVDQQSRLGAATVTTSPVSEIGSNLPVWSTPDTTTTPGVMARPVGWVPWPLLLTAATTTTSLLRAYWMARPQAGVGASSP